MQSAPQIVRQTARLAIVRLDIKSVFDRYHAGFFAREPVKKSLIKGYKAVSLIRDVLSENSDDPRFWYLNHVGDRILVAKSGYRNCQDFKTKGGDAVALGPPRRCWYCTQDCDKPSGYPVSLSSEESLVDNEYSVIDVFWTEGSFCDESCKLSYLKRSNLPSKSEYLSLLYLLHNLAGAGTPIQEANPMELLICNGGVMTNEEWLKTTAPYHWTATLIRMPVERQYVMDARLDSHHAESRS